MLPRLFFFFRKKITNLSGGIMLFWVKSMLLTITVKTYVGGLSGLIAFPHLFILAFVFVVLLLFQIWMKILFLYNNKLLARFKVLEVSE